MKVAVLADLSWHHGIRLAKELSTRVNVLAITQSKPIGQPAFPYHLILKGDLNPTQYLAKVGDYRIVLDKFKPDVIHASNVMVNGVFAHEAGRVPYIDTILGSDLLMLANKKPDIKDRIIKGMISASLVTSDTDELIQLAHSYGVPLDRELFWSLGVDTKLFNPGFDPSQLIKAYDLAHYPVILSGRRLAPLYNHELIIKGFSQLLQKYPDAILMFLGDFVTRDYEQEILKLILDLKLSKSIRFIPPLPYQVLPAIYRASTIFISVPKSDGLPISILEALACGTAVLAVGKEKDKYGPVGIKPQPDPDEITDGAHQLLGLSKKEWNRYSRIGREMVIETFEMAQMVDILVDKYDQVRGATL